MNSQTHTISHYRYVYVETPTSVPCSSVCVCVCVGGGGEGVSQILVTRSFECEDPGLIAVLSSVYSNSILNHFTGQF